MEKNRFIKCAFFVFLFLYFTFSLTCNVWAQATQQPIIITVKDEVAGGLAEGVTVIIEGENGTVVQTFQTTAETPIQTSLPKGNYTIIAQISLFGVPSTLGTKSLSVTKPTEIEIKVSAVVMPVKYLTWVTYSTTAVTGISTAFFSLRHVLKLRKFHELIGIAKTALPAISVSGAVVVGTNITVRPNSNVLLTFSQVKQAGQATANPLTIYPPLPKGASFLGTVWDIKNTAAFTGMAVVGILFDGSNLNDEQKKKLKVCRIDLDKNSSWKDVTSSIDIENNIAYGKTDHFSGFGIH